MTPASYDSDPSRNTSITSSFDSYASRTIRSRSSRFVTLRPVSRRLSACSSSSHSFVTDVMSMTDSYQAGV
ncbi:hypothetical protein NJ7G_0492 [Natrinema sp. J7-2]|nr:hypothetical protein NJ7G_0492 [Natrinema sp. J7-2]